MVRTATLGIVLTICSDCAQDGIQSHAAAQPVVRHTNWKKWKRLQPEQTLEFGSWRVHAPSQSQRGGSDATRVGKFEQREHQMKGELEFQLEHSGSPVATVSATARREVDTVAPGIISGRFATDGHDQLDGRIQLAGYSPAEFSITGFSTDSQKAKAVGSLTVNQQRIIVREIDAPWHDYRDGFAGAEFFVNDQRVAQVIRAYPAVIGGGKNESVWIDPALPSEVKTAIAGTSATLLLAKRLEPNPPAAD